MGYGPPTHFKGPSSFWARMNPAIGMLQVKMAKVGRTVVIFSMTRAKWNQASKLAWPGPCCMYDVCSYKVNLSKIVAFKIVNRSSFISKQIDLDVVPISRKYANTFHDYMNINFNFLPSY